MRKLFIALLLVCVGLLIADPIPIGEGTETNHHLPMECFYGYTYSQVIYTAEEIGGAVDIETVAWHFNGNSTWTEDCVIYMGHTTLDEFGAYPSWIPIEDLTQVWAGGFTTLEFEHWLTVELDNAFAYNGTDNLVIAFDANTPGYSSSMDEFYGTATTLNRSIYYYSDGTDPDPANPPLTRGVEEYDELGTIKTGKTTMRASGVQAMIANIILNNDATMPSGLVNGHVYEDGTTDPIEGATVSVGTFQGTTDAAGFYEIEIFVEGVYTVSASHPDYFAGTDEVTVVFDQTETIDFYLEPFENIGDTIEDPIIVDAFPFFMTGDMSLYTDYSTGAGLENGRSGKDIYFQVDLTEGATAEFHCCGSDFDTYMNLYDDQYVNISYDDDGCSTWPTGSGLASWLGQDDGSYVVVLTPGTYYVAIEGYSASSEGIYEAHLDILPPPEFGNIDGTVTDSETFEPIAGADVTVDGVTMQTDAAGYYSFMDLETGLYNVDVAATGYNQGSVMDVEVLADETTTVDVALDPLAGVVFEMTVDSWPTEATWNVWNLATQSYVWGTDWGFTTGGETVIVSEDLDDGNYEVHCWDTYGDGGIAGVVNKEGVILAEWASGDYTTEGIFPFTVGPILFGDLDGTVTDNFTNDPISGATIVCGNYQGTTDAAGYYNIEVLVGTYLVTCDAAGYTGQEVMDVVVEEDMTTTVDFGLDIIMEPPTNLVATVDGYDVGLEWDAPYIPPTDILHWDDMTNVDAIGLTAGGTFSVAARFTPTELAAFDGLVMDNVTVYINDLPSAMTLYVWTGADAANVLLQQTVTPVGLDWNNFVLNTPVVIDASDEMWIGYEVVHDAGMYPAGCDGGPAVAEFGDLISQDGGVTWDALSGLGLDYNWNIWGGIAGERGEDMVLARPQVWNPEIVQNENRELSLAGTSNYRPFTEEYHVWRDDVVIATVAETMYDDLGLDAGVYEYYVTAVYDEGDSPESNHVMIEMGYADVAVDPLMISETLDYGLTADHNIELTNSGDGNFYWTGSIVDQVRFDVGETKPRTAGSVNENAELGTDAQMFEVPETREMWDMLYTGIWGADIVSQAGFETDGEYCYTAVWNAATINKYDFEGNFIESFEIPGVSGLRDLAYDGTYFYGGAAGTQIWEMDFDTQTLVSTITSPVAVRAIAYDEVSDGFWVNNWDTDITLVGRDGSMMDSFPCSTTYGSLYGMAYDNVTDGGPFIYGFSQDGSGCVINQMSIATGADTGVFHDVLLDTGVAGDIAGGMFTSSDVVAGTYIIGAFNQGSYTATYYELTPFSTWLAIEPSSGTLAPGESVTVTATFDACELPGLTYNADIIFSDGEASAAVAADLTITGSIPTAELTYDPAEFAVTIPAEGTMDCDLNIGNEGDLALEYEAEIIYYEGRAIANAYPQSADYWTGSFDAASFTSTSAINLVDIEDGWAMFDVSGIPDGAIINSIEANVYVSDTHYPWWSITPCTLDPLNTDAATLATHIIGNEGTGVAYSYNNESSTFAAGWQVYPLEGTANADLEAALGQDWFACGLTSRDNSATYYVNIDGWNEANPPYLVIDYSIPINPWVTFDGDMTMDGVVEVGAGANAHNLHFDAAGLVDGDVMMGEIVLSCNDLYNEEVIIPLTMTVGATYMYGDVTGDEVVDALDAATVLQYTVSMDPTFAPLPWTWELIAGDVDGNGAPEAFDAALILQYSVQMIDEFPVEARMDVPVADVSMTVENGELVFSTTGNLYGFSVATETDLISFGEVEMEYLHASNGNAVALANAEAIDGEFLRIPFEKEAEMGEFTLTMNANGVSSEHTYNVEELETAPIVNAVLGNYPNPFNPTTFIKLQVKEATPVSVDIYNIKGQLVKSLVNETVETGVHSFEWSGSDNSSRPVSSGVYFYKVKIGELNETHKMIMLK